MMFSSRGRIQPPRAACVVGATLACAVRHGAAPARRLGVGRPRPQRRPPCRAAVDSTSAEDDSAHVAAAVEDGAAAQPPPLVAQLEADKEEFVTSAGVVHDVEGDEAQFDAFGESTEGSLHFVQRLQRAGVSNLFGLDSLEGIVTADVARLEGAVAGVLGCLGVPPESDAAARPDRAVYCSRTLNLRSIKCIGYDLDYTLIHYDVEAWEGRAYEYGREALRAAGVPVDGLRFDSSLVIRGLIMDKELGNLIKVDRFGLVKRAMHGTQMMSWQEIREAYGREVVNLRNEGRWVFLNTLFSISEAVLFAQLVDRLDQGAFGGHGGGGGGGGPGGLLGQLTYQSLYRMVARALYRTHVEGKLKAEIVADPARYVELDGDMARTLLDQRDSGKMLLLITNSDHAYTSALMSYAYDRYLPAGMTWRDLFDMVIVTARKPDFFLYSQSLYEIVTPDGLMRPVLAAKPGGLYCGGSARMVEKALGVEGDDILYVGDIYTDAALSKLNMRWRTALILRELEDEIGALARGRPHRAQLKELMAKRELVGSLFDHLRLARQRAIAGRALGMGAAARHGALVQPGGGGCGSGSSGSSSRDDSSVHRAAAPAAAAAAAAAASSSASSAAAAAAAASVQSLLGGSAANGALAESFEDEQAVNETLGQLLVVLERLDAAIGPMLERDGHHFNERWGFLSRAGLNDKSQLCRQIEKYADVYTSRVSNLMRYTPYMYFRSPSQSLAHDRGLTAWYEDVLLGQREGGGLGGGDGDVSAAADLAHHANGGAIASSGSMSNTTTTSSHVVGTAAKAGSSDADSTPPASSIGAR